MSDPFLQGMLDNAFGIVPGSQQVTVIRNTTTLATGVTALQRPLSFKDMQVVGTLEMTDIAATFEIQLSTYGSDVQIHQGDLIVDENSVTWKIVSMGEQLYNTVLRPICTQVRGT